MSSASVVEGLSGSLCNRRDLRVRDRVSWAGEDHAHGYTTIDS
jgi:hypothetical protein